MSTSKHKAGTQRQREADDTHEAHLLAAVAQGDRKAFETLYRIYHRRLGRFVMRTLARHDVTDEIINDVMMVVWNKAASFDGASRPSTWIFGIAYNKARHYFSAGAAVESAELEDPAVPAQAHWQHALELRDLLEKSFARLSPDHRMVIELTYFHGMHYQEIAQVMNCPENTVKTRMFHARRHLMAFIGTARDD